MAEEELVLECRFGFLDALAGLPFLVLERSAVALGMDSELVGGRDERFGYLGWFGGVSFGVGCSEGGY